MLRLKPRQPVGYIAGLLHTLVAHMANIRATYDNFGRAEVVVNSSNIFHASALPRHVRHGSRTDDHGDRNALNVIPVKTALAAAISSHH